MKYLGDSLDIHCGGVDNIFPHHTNEIAQSEAYIGHKWCNYWFHIQHLNDKKGKMSKSSGEFLTVSLLEEKGYNPLVYRMFCLQSHYRKPLEFDYDILNQVAGAYKKLTGRIAQLSEDGNPDETVLEQYRNKFIDALGNDLNTSMGITVIYDLMKESCNDATKLALLKEFDTVLSLGLLENKEEEKTVDAAILALIEDKIAERVAAKKDKNFAKADAIREELLAMGIAIKDTREGTVWEQV